VGKRRRGLGEKRARLSLVMVMVGLGRRRKVDRETRVWLGRRKVERKAEEWRGVVKPGTAKYGWGRTELNFLKD
jgi:hypothetical protein